MFELKQNQQAEIREREPVKSQKQNLSNSDNVLLSSILRSIPDPSLVLNQKEKIVAFNIETFQLFNAETEDDLLGKRFGEILNCIHNNEHNLVCGKSDYCKNCDLEKIVCFCGDGDKRISGECTITSMVNGNLVNNNFMMYSSPVKIDGENYNLITIKDLTELRRKEALERIFYHDVLNTANAVSGLSELMRDAESIEEIKEYSGILRESVQELIHEINVHKDIHIAQKDLLEVRFEKTTANILLKRINDLYAHHYLSDGKQFLVEELTEDVTFETDITLLIRSLSNLVKNALEATIEGDVVNLFARTESGRIYFHVFNSGVIPKNIQSQIFYKSFSTKGGNDRGVGTYSVKLLVEKYLEGVVSFVSNENVKTIFTINLPLKLS